MRKNEENKKDVVHVIDALRHIIEMVEDYLKPGDTVEPGPLILGILAIAEAAQTDQSLTSIIFKIDEVNHSIRQKRGQLMRQKAEENRLEQKAKAEIISMHMNEVGMFNPKLLGPNEASQKNRMMVLLNGMDEDSPDAATFYVEIRIARQNTEAELTYLEAELDRLKDFRYGLLKSVALDMEARRASAVTEQNAIESAKVYNDTQRIALDIAGLNQIEHARFQALLNLTPPASEN